MKKDIHEGARKFSPFVAKNKMAITETLLPCLPPQAHVLEIASGSGEHGLHICRQRPDVTWQCSDISSEARESQDSWASEANGQMPKALNIDCTQKGWHEKVARADVIFCANMIHIAPWTAAEGLAEGAGILLPVGGVCILYGPFLEGDQTAQSNIDFDANLKSRNPAWGVRDLDAVKHIFAQRGFNKLQITVMPSNNRLLAFSRL
jgi:hypothetical protein